MRSTNAIARGALRLPAALLAMILCAGVQAQSNPLLQEVHTIATADTGVPIEHSIDISNSDTYQVQLTDLGIAIGSTSTPPQAAPLASLKLAITNGSALVGSPLAGAGTLSFSGTQGTYVLHVIGKPGAIPGSGPIGIKVLDSKGNVLYVFSDDIALPQRSLPNSQAALDGSFTVPSSGNYQVTLTDLHFPAALSLVTLAVTVEGGALVTTLPDTGGGMQAAVSLQAGVNYKIFALAAAGTQNAGLYSANVSAAGGGASAFSKTVPVGGTGLLGSTSLSPASYTLTVTDLAYPGALTQAGALVVLGGQAVTTQAVPGTNASFTVGSTATYEAYSVASAAPQGAGSYAAVIQAGSSPPALSVARALAASDSNISPYAFNTTISAPGGYVADLADFQFPNALSSLGLAVVQNAQILGTPLSAAGQVPFTGATGPLTLLAFATAGSSGGLFGAGVTPNGTTTPIFEITQGVGTTFIARQVSVTSAGNYIVSAADVGFPAPFTNFAVVVTQGTGRIGQITGTSGTFPFTANAGNYFLNFIAQPAGPDNAGTYSLSFAPADPAPVVSFTVNTTQVGSGGTVQLSWSAQNATSCVASGGWSGSQQTTGQNVTSSALTTDTTFTLTCSGTGGTTAKSVTVTVSQKSSGGGGGGSLDAFLLALFTLLVMAQQLRRYGARGPA